MGKSICWNNYAGDFRVLPYFCFRGIRHSVWIKLFSVENEDGRINPKTVIYGVEIDGSFKAYKEDDFANISGGQ